MHSLDTERLRLRFLRAEDAPRLAAMVSNWNVHRMLRMAPMPYTLEVAADWIASHENERRAGTAFRYAVERHGTLIGMADVDSIDDRNGSVGYWLEEPAWGQGFAGEAARAVCRFAFEDLRLDSLHAGRAFDNEASGHVLEKLGFTRVGEAPAWSIPRNEMIRNITYVLPRAQWTGAP